MEFYESTYFIVLFPIVVITALLLFFWLFMKETSYDEVLAKHKKDLKLPPAKIDKKKTDKKKNKKKDTQNGNFHESDSETALRDFELGDALSSEEEHVVPAPIIPVETIGSVRERKKKEKKMPKPMVKEPVNKEVNGTKVPVKKPEPIPVTKQPTPPPETTVSKKKAGSKKQKNGQDDSPNIPEPKNEQVVPCKKQESVIPMAEVKPQESGSGKKTAPKKKHKTENLLALVDEPLIHPTVYIPLMDNTEPPLVEKKDVVNFEKAEIPEVTQRGGGKKGKHVTDKGEHKENTEVKFKDFVAAIKSMIFSDDEAMSVVEMLKDKSGSVKDMVHKAHKGGSAAALQIQEKEKQLASARDEAAIVKEQCKQLTQELLAEKQKSSLVEAKARERINVLEKETGVFQSKLHGSFQEAQQMQVKFQQVREQLENQLTHLKQENGILRDAVSSATNQMESKQSNELIKLRQDYARLVKEVNDKNSSLAQEELQKKNQEQVVAGLKAQIQDAERRREDVESYLRKRMADSEKALQDFQPKYIAKDAEVQSLHSKLTDTMVSNQQLEQRIMQLMDAGQDNLQIQVQDLLTQNEAMNIQIQKYHSQMQAQSSASVIVEELQKTIEEKDKEIKQMEESLSLERVNFANNGEELKDLRKQNESMNIQIQKYITQIQTQASATVLVEELQKTIAEKDKEIKQMKDAVALGQANFVNSGEELKTLQRENISLKAELQRIQAVKSEQEVASQTLEQLERSVADKEEKIKLLEERLEAQLGKVSTNLEEHKALQNLNNELQVQVQKLQEQLLDQANKELLGQMEQSMQEKDEKIKTVEELLETGLIQVANKEEELRMLRDENAGLRMDVLNLKAQHNDQVASAVENLKSVIHEKDGKIRSVEDLLQAEQLRTDKEGKIVQALTKEIEALKEALGNSQLEKAEQVSSIAQVQDLQNQLKGKEETLKKVEERFNERERLILEKERQIEDLQKESLKFKIHIEEVQHRLQQQDSGSTGAQDLQRIVEQQEQKIKDMEAIILEREKSIAGTTQELTGLIKVNEILKIQASELQKIHDQQLQQVSSVSQSEELLKALAEKDRSITELLGEVESQKAAVEQQRKKNNEKPQNLHTGEMEAREILQKIFPNVSVSASLHHGEWIQEFEKLAKVCLNENGGNEKVKALEQKLKEGEEIHTLLQLESEKYKSVLAETEGILQRLQRSVEEEEGRWKLKLEESQTELREAASAVHLLEQEGNKLKRRNKEVENLLKEKENLETELEKAELERTTYVSEVRELKSQLNDTLKKLEVEQNERQKVASDLHEAQKSLDLIQIEILKGSEDSNVIENSGISLEKEEQDRIEKMPQSLSQSVTQLRQCLQAVNQQLTKGRENFQIIG